MTTKTIKTGILFRNCTLLRDDIDVDNRTVDLSFSSEEPIDRWWGAEILDHKKSSVDLNRLNKGGALLLDHDTRDQVGVIEKATVGSDRKGRALVRFGKSGRADEVFNDVADGIRQNVSVGYRIHKMKQEESDPDNPIFRATRWEPMEISLVSVPADTSVGVGRSEADLNFETLVERQITKEAIMPDLTVKETPAQVIAPAIDTKKIEETARKAATEKEQTRCRELAAYGEQFNCREDAVKAIADGTAVDDFRRALLERTHSQLVPVKTKPALGLSENEKSEFRIVRAINALANPSDKNAQLAAGFELECSREYGKLVNRQPRGFFVPPEVWQRDINVTTDSAGGYTVGTDLLAANFIELLRNKMIVRQAGATMLTGLVGDVAIPSLSGGATAYWVAESGAVTESAQTFGQLALTPKTVGAMTDLSRKLLIQSAIDIENFVRNDLATVVAIALDLAALHGTGADNQPTGVAATSGIGSVAGGTNGLAPTYAHMLSLETEVAQDNADIGALGYVTNAKVRGKLKQIFTNATYGEIPIWTKGSAPGIGELNGYPAHVSNQVSSALTKGSSDVCSAIFFGNWRDLIVALWSSIDILVDPYTGSSSGTVRVVALQDADIGVRHAVSFAAMLDALTA